MSNMNSPPEQEEAAVKDIEGADSKDGVNIRITIGDDGGTPLKTFDKGKKKKLFKQDSINSNATPSNHDQSVLISF